jgi:hypothetical protein
LNTRIHEVEPAHGVGQVGCGDTFEALDQLALGTWWIRNDSETQFAGSWH